MGVQERLLRVQEQIRDAMVGTHSVEFPIFAWTEADGTALADFSAGTSTTPGFDFTASEMTGIRWNNDAAPDPIACGVMLPRNFDGTRDATLYIWCSKVGATVGDATTFDVLVYAQSVGDLHDADADFGDTTSAIDGDAATKTIQQVSLTLAAANLPDNGPVALNVSLQPTDGTLGTDDIIVHRVWVEHYVKAT